MMYKWAGGQGDWDKGYGKRGERGRGAEIEGAGNGERAGRDRAWVFSIIL